MCYCYLGPGRLADAERWPPYTVTIMDRSHCNTKTYSLLFKINSHVSVQLGSQSPNPTVYRVLVSIPVCLTPSVYTQTLDTVYKQSHTDVFRIGKLI